MIGGGLLKPIGQTLGRTVKYGKNLADDIYRVGAVTYDEIIAAGYILAPMVSKPARIEIIGGIVAGYVYDLATRQSPDSRSERNASDVGSGGNRPQTMKPMLSDSSIRWNLKNGYSMHATTEHACGLGYRLVKRKGKYVCVKK